jgi:starch synthase (maltosyl-transferring)
VALDVAFQCSPDHPWVAEHPEWFRHRPDGSIRYAENPPKKYEDIYPLDFETEDWEALGRPEEVSSALDGPGCPDLPRRQPPHQGLPFWEWVIGELKAGIPGSSSSRRPSPDPG